MKKLYDAVVITGKYTNRDGQEKKRYENVGVVMEGDNGIFLLLNAHFNPAGIKEPGRDKIAINFFAPKEAGQSAHDSAKANGYQSQPIDDEIPF